MENSSKRRHDKTDKTSNINVKRADVIKFDNSVYLLNV